MAMDDEFQALLASNPISDDFVVPPRDDRYEERDWSFDEILP